MRGPGQPSRVVTAHAGLACTRHRRAAALPAHLLRPLRLQQLWKVRGQRGTSDRECQESQSQSKDLDDVAMLAPPSVGGQASRLDRQEPYHGRQDHHLHTRTRGRRRAGSMRSRVLLRRGCSWGAPACCGGLRGRRRSPPGGPLPACLRAHRRRCLGDGGLLLIRFPDAEVGPGRHQHGSIDRLRLAAAPGRRRLQGVVGASQWCRAEQAPGAPLRQHPQAGRTLLTHGMHGCSRAARLAAACCTQGSPRLGGQAPTHLALGCRTPGRRGRIPRRVRKVGLQVNSLRLALHCWFCSRGCWRLRGRGCRLRRRRQRRRLGSCWRDRRLHCLSLGAGSVHAAVASACPGPHGSMQAHSHAPQGGDMHASVPPALMTLLSAGAWGELRLELGLLEELPRAVTLRSPRVGLVGQRRCAAAYLAAFHRDGVQQLVRGGVSLRMPAFQMPRNDQCGPTLSRRTHTMTASIKLKWQSIAFPFRGCCWRAEA
jgi:hypothetical protein